ncbi:MAG: pyridoxal phosphate-dependent aminotransferase family protein [Flavobacterium sp.]|nr:pyridoxal phosphate-dependent aminotransferase family protein [Flavobacterium sp.]
MKKFPENLLIKIETRKQNNAFRELPLINNLIDFSSNDYLGFAKSEIIFNKSHQYLLDKNLKINGATGSRLISGNHELYQETESFIADFHQSETALIFNSGYDANVGFFGCVPQRNDIIVFDELCHASIRDGILMSNAKSHKFNHNDFEDLEKKIEDLKLKIKYSAIYIVTESVFSMDGDCPNLDELVRISEKHNCFLVIDEAHAVGVFGDNGQGLVQEHQLQGKIFARIITFGKGLGCHGAAVLGSQNLKDYLVNFARSFVYTTGLSPHSIATILKAYEHLSQDETDVKKLRDTIIHFNQQKNLLGLKPLFVRSKSAIQSAIIPGNENAKYIAKTIQNNGFSVKAILSPTVPAGQERLRICLHSYDSKEEISKLLNLIITNIH